MNVHQVLGFLRAEKEKLDRVIASLEELEAISSHTVLPRRRGRKYMSEEERRTVSARMKRFWAKHKKRQ